MTLAQVSIPMLALWLALAANASAQFIGPIPPATPPTPEYVAPPPHQPGEIVPSETAPTAPSIIERAEDGRIKPLTSTAEEAAVAKYPFDAERRAKITKSTAARTLDLDRFVAANVEKVVAARAMRPKVENAGDFAPLFEARDAALALKYERLLDRLLRDGAITMLQRSRLDEALKDYEKARKDEIEKEAAADPTRTAILHLRQSFADATREQFDSLDRQINDLADNFESIVPRLHLDVPHQSKATAAGDALKSAKATPNLTLAKARRDIVRSFFFDDLDAESRRATLTAGLAAKTEPAGGR